MSEDIGIPEINLEIGDSPLADGTRRMEPHVIREFAVVKVKDLRVGQIFYHDFDNFVFFFTTHKWYITKFEKDKAIVQALTKQPDGGWFFNIRAAYDLEQEVYVITGEHVSLWEKKDGVGYVKLATSSSQCPQS